MSASEGGREREGESEGRGGEGGRLLKWGEERMSAYQGGTDVSIRGREGDREGGREAGRDDDAGRHYNI